MVRTSATTVTKRIYFLACKYNRMDRNSSGEKLFMDSKDRNALAKLIPVSGEPDSAFSKMNS